MDDHWRPVIPVPRIQHWKIVSRKRRPLQFKARNWHFQSDQTWQNAPVLLQLILKPPRIVVYWILCIFLNSGEWLLLLFLTHNQQDAWLCISWKVIPSRACCRFHIFTSSLKMWSAGADAAAGRHSHIHCDDFINNNGNNSWWPW